jgi:hypothetical protein
MNLTSSLVFEAEYDQSGNTGGDDYSSAKIKFVYPPRNEKPSLDEDFISDEAFYKRDMTSTLEEKVKRNNDIIIETQGAIIVTSK